MNGNSKTRKKKLTPKQLAKIEAELLDHEYHLSWLRNMILEDAADLVARDPATAREAILAMRGYIPYCNNARQHYNIPLRYAAREAAIQ